jgi:hypothetical protein
MAPELVFGEKATKASDVWSLGIVLHEVLFGSRPEWTIARRSRRLRAPDSANGMLARGLLKLCAECLAELPADRSPDAVAVKRRFERLVGGWIRGRWKLPTVAIALSAVLMALALPLVRDRGSPPRSALVGTAADLTSSSISLLRTDRVMRWCAQLLPGPGSTLRLFLEGPAEALDLDLESGRHRPSNLVPEALTSGCAQLSPDGQRLLYERIQPDRGPQVMLSAAPDGRDAVPVTDGEGAYWLPSGDAFLYTVDYTRSEVFWFGHGHVPLATSGTGTRRVIYHGANDRGDEIAVLFARSSPTLGMSLDIYGYPQTNLLRSVELPPGGFTWVQNDPKRNTWQLSLRDPARLTLCEVNRDGTCGRLIKSAVGDVIASYRSRLGLVAIASRRVNSSVLKDKSGQSQVYSDHTGIDFSPAGDAVMGLPLDDGRFVIAVQRKGQTRPQIVSDGPFDGSPAVNPDGKSFIYADYERRSVIRCAFDVQESSECHAIHQAPSAPTVPRLSPDGRLLAYGVADAAGARLRIVAMNAEGSTRDLGIPTIGPLRWTSPSRLWLCERIPRQWEEIDAIAGIRTGEVLPVPNDAEALNPCGRPPPALADRFSDFEVTTGVKVTQEIRLARDM